MSNQSWKTISRREWATWVGILGVVGLFSYSIAQPHDHDHALGLPAPPFVLYDDAGKPVSLEGLRGQKVILNVYANWCPPCRAEFPDFAEFHRGLGAQSGVALYGVLFESGPPTEAIPASRELGVSWPILVGDGLMAKDYELETYPTTLLIDAEGIVRFRHEGTLSAAQLKALVERGSL